MNHFRIDPAEVGNGGAGAVGGKLDPQRPPQRLDPCLGDRVGTVSEPVYEGIDRGDYDDLSTALHDLGEDSASGPPDAKQVDLKNPFPLLTR